MAGFLNISCGENIVYSGQYGKPWQKDNKYAG